MKASKPVYRQVSVTGFTDEFATDGDLFATWPHIFATVALVLACILAVAVFLLYKRLRTLCLVIAMMSGQHPAISAANAQVLAPSPALNWRPNTSTPTPARVNHPLVYNPTPPLPQAHAETLPSCEPPISNHLLLGLELLSLALLLIFLIKYSTTVLKTMVYRSEVYLEITNGKVYVDIYLTSLAYCPTEYDLCLACWIQNLSLLKRGLGTDDLFIAWPRFYLQEIKTGQTIVLPKTIKLTLYQCYRMRKIVMDNYTVHPKIIHGGRAFYVTKGTPSHGVSMSTVGMNSNPVTISTFRDIIPKPPRFPPTTPSAPTLD